MPKATEEEKALVPQNGTAQLPAARYAHEKDEVDAFGQSNPDELILPVVKLVQGVSRKADTRRAGEYWDEVTDEYKTEMRVAILAMSRSRSLFEDGAFDQPPICASDDSVRPRQVVATKDGEATGPTCAECAFSQWGTARQGQGRGQACRMSYNLLLFDLEDGGIFIARISGTSIAGWRRYMTAGRLGKTPAYALETVLSSEQKEYTAGKAYVMTFRAGGPLPKEIAEALRQEAAAYRGVSLGVEDVVEEEAVVGGDAEPLFE